MVISICKNCQGKGFIEDGLPHDREDIECSVCLGFGRMHEQTFTLTLPLTKKNEFLNKSTIIINLLNSK